MDALVGYTEGVNGWGVLRGKWVHWWGTLRGRWVHWWGTLKG